MSLPSNLFTYPYGGKHGLNFQTTLGFPQALPLLPIVTNATYLRHFILPILTAVAVKDTTVPAITAPSCLSLCKKVRYFSGASTFINSYSGILHCHHISPNSTPSCFALYNHVKHCHFYHSLRRQPTLPPRSQYFLAILF